MSDSIGIYVHIPYCVTKCPYCDFNSYATQSPVPQLQIPPNASRRTALLEEQQYTQALLAELKYHADQEEWNGRDCQSIFFGGGTPSLFSEHAIAAILTALNQHFRIASDCEITLEANPGTVAEALGRERLFGFRAAGVNRLSFGAQSFNAEKLRFLGRLHAVDDIRRSVDNAGNAGFDNWNLDLIYGMPTESTAQWDYDLQAALSTGPMHISAYCLTIEPGTEFGVRHSKGLFSELPSAQQAELFSHTQQVLQGAGFEQYEISNFARRDRQCRHNLGYWHWLDYLSLGAGAHSFLKHKPAASPNGMVANGMVASRWANIPKPAHYIERALAQGDCAQRTESVDLVQAELEYLLCHLRTSQGIDEAHFTNYFGYPFYSRFADVLPELARNGLLRSSSQRTCVTPKGFLFVDEILLRLSESKRGKSKAVKVTAAQAG